MEAESAMIEPQGTEPKPLFIAEELPNGVRFVATPTTEAKGGPLPTLFGTWLVSIAILITAGVFSGMFIERTWGLVSLSLSIVSLLYLLQLAWDAYAFSRAFFQINAFSHGKFVIEIAGNRLKAGHRWGPFWLSPGTVPLSELIRLVIVRRPSEHSPDQSAFNWDLIAQHRGGMPITLVSEFDESTNVRTVAKDLHARLAASSHLSATLSPLQKELWPANALLSLPPKPPSSRRKNMYPHLAGSFGLGCMLVAVSNNPPTPPWFLGVAVPMILLQGLILVTCVFLFRASRNRGV